MKKVLATLLIMALLVSMVPHAEASEEMINVVATLEIFSYFVKEIGGDRVNVSYIVPRGQDIHSYSLTYEDVKKLDKADLIVLASSEFFSIDRNIKDKVQGKRILDFENYNPVVYPLGNFKRNIHGYWLYPPNALNISRAIMRELQIMDPQHGEYYRENFLKFERALNYTVEEVRTMAREANLENESVLLTVPGSFYVVKYLGLSIEGTIVEGPHQFISEEELNRVKEDIKDGKISYIVDIQGLASSKSGQIAIQLSRETGVKVVYIDIFSTGNYTALLLKDAAILSSAKNVETYGHAWCDYSFYIITTGLLLAVSVILFVIAYSYRRELLK